MQKFFDTAVERRPDHLSLCYTTPLGGSGDRAGVCRESDQPCLLAISFPDQLAQGQLPVDTHLGGPCVTDMRIVRPHHNPCRFPPFCAAPKMRAQGCQGLEHVLISQIPGGDPAAEHRPVVLFRIAHGQRVLLRVEQVVLGEESVAARILQPIALQIHQLVDHLPFTGHSGAESRGIPVGLAVVGRDVRSKQA